MYCACAIAITMQPMRHVRRSMSSVRTHLHSRPQRQSRSSFDLLNARGTTNAARHAAHSPVAEADAIDVRAICMEQPVEMHSVDGLLRTTDVMQLFSLQDHNASTYDHQRTHHTQHPHHTHITNTTFPFNNTTTLDGQSLHIFLAGDGDDDLMDDLMDDLVDDLVDDLMDDLLNDWTKDWTIQWTFF